MIYLGSKGDEFTSVAHNTDIRNSAQLACRQSTAAFDANEFDIQSIHVISKAESKKVHLLAVTTSGYRLYFTHHKDALRSGTYMQPAVADVPPNALELIHVRLPPAVEISGPSPMLQGQQSHFGSIHAAYYDCGTLLAAKTIGQDKRDVLLMTAMDLGDYSNQQTGSNTSIPNNASAYAVRSALYKYQVLLIACHCRLLVTRDRPALLKQARPSNVMVKFGRSPKQIHKIEAHVSSMKFRKHYPIHHANSLS